MYDCLSKYPVIDLLVAALGFFCVYKAWANTEQAETKDEVAERALGASVIMGQLGSVITGVSIIIAGVGAFVALGLGHLGFPENYHLLYSASWAVLALGLALYTMGTLPTRTRNENFVASKGVAILCAMALFFSLFAGIRFLFAIAGILLSLP